MQCCQNILYLEGNHTLFGEKLYFIWKVSSGNTDNVMSCGIPVLGPLLHAGNVDSILKAMVNPNKQAEHTTERQSVGACIVNVFGLEDHWFRFLRMQ